MKNEYLKLIGHVYWAKVYEPDTAFGQTNFKIDFVPLDDAQWEKFNKSGIQKEVKENDKMPGKYFGLTRSAFKLIKGAVVNFTGPVILDQDGKVIVDYVSKESGRRVYSYDEKKKDDVVRRGSPILIGNGSKAEVTVQVYDTMKGKGQRLEQIKILELVEYQQSLPELSNMVTEAKGVDSRGLDDEIPFDNTGEDKKLPW